MNGGKPITFYRIHIVSHVNKKALEDVLVANNLVWKEIYITPENTDAYVYFHDEPEMNLSLHAFRDKGYNIQESALQTTSTTRWMDGCE
jgi:hypothetical protein